MHEPRRTLGVRPEPDPAFGTVVGGREHDPERCRIARAAAEATLHVLQRRHLATLPQVDDLVKYWGDWLRDRGTAARPRCVSCRVRGLARRARSPGDPSASVLLTRAARRRDRAAGVPGGPVRWRLGAPRMARRPRRARRRRSPSRRAVRRVGPSTGADPGVVPHDRDADPDVERARARARARAHLTDLLRGAERWCQGFSEPDAGSDLASLRTKAVRDGDDWIVDGHKIWTSQATVSSRCVVLLRTGTPESRHRGLSMMLVDHDAPGVEVREIRTMSGRDELGEVLFDGVRVPGDRLIGNDGDGWALAMYLLQWERGMYPWQRQAGLFGTLDALLERTGDAIDPHALADAYLAVLPMRLSSAQTIRRLAAGETPGPEVSVDKVLLARAELMVFDLRRHRVRRRDRVRRRRAGTRGVAPRLPVQPLGADLRRFLRDPAPDPGRPGAGDAPWVT